MKHGVRRAILDVSFIDSDTKRVSQRVTAALGFQPAIKSAVISSVDELLLQLQELIRENLGLHFLVENPGFNLETQVISDRSYIRNLFDAGTPFSSLCQKYGYDFFESHYYPEYITSLCKVLIDACADYNQEPFELWTILIESTGLIPQTLVENFGPTESDEGLI